MLTSIQSLRRFGIFDAYARPAGTKDFGDRNVIYGWNYSGKTTISRLFHAIDRREVPADLAGCSFALTDGGGGTVTHANLAASAHKVRVFNSDFVAESLNWNGGAFRPILLLGAEAQDAQGKISHLENVMSRCVNSAAACRREAQQIVDKLSEAKTAAAKQIKTTLGLVEPFTAVHLDKQVELVTLLDDQVHTLTAEQLANDLSLANASEKDRLPAVPEITFSPVAQPAWAKAVALLKKLPASSSVIEALKQDPTLATWVGQGLSLHQHTADCAFCLNPFSDERRKALEAHFSRELTDFTAALQLLEAELLRLRHHPAQVREADLNVQFRARLAPLLVEVNAASNAYNQRLEEARSAVAGKFANPFADAIEPADPGPVVETLTHATTALNALIRESNAITQNFLGEKAAAVKRLKAHYAFQFTVDFKTADVAQQQAERLGQARRFDRAREQAQAKLKEQQARINRAQNGREKINERIVSLLNSKSVQIDVVSEGGADHFVLKRHGRIARNLSEGEKTAIAFAFFLTKLLEESDLQEVIVFIDDPISSLDSNHIFQVFSILKTVFFTKRPNAAGHATTCHQLFVATHNFEFFSLLRDLPDDKQYFMTKRLSPTDATLINLPETVSRYPSEYHYLFHVLHTFDQSGNKADTEHLLALPNAARRFLELYTYAKLPLGRHSKVEQRAARLFGSTKAQRILKVLHHFSHLESVERLMTNTNALADIEGAIAQLMDCIREDKEHYEALVDANK
jgi:wobble nucleotide-excising tRNase